MEKPRKNRDTKEETEEMQLKISSFFKLSPISPSPKWVLPRSGPPRWSRTDDGLDLWASTRSSFHCTFKRRSPTRRSDSTVASEFGSGRGPGAGNVLNKKRRYPQMFLELGQSDFNLRTCGIKYSPGDDLNEKHHNTFHKNYTQGIPFKVFRNERVVELPDEGGERVVVASDCDPQALRNKMQEVIRMMEIELGDGWILRNYCKVQYRADSHSACLCLFPSRELLDVLLLNQSKKHLIEVISSEVNVVGENFTVCEDEAKPAACGVRAIWVTPSNRRKHIASRLLDAARRNFCEGIVLDKANLAFSIPISSGKACNGHCIILLCINLIVVERPTSITHLYKAYTTIPSVLPSS